MRARADRERLTDADLFIFDTPDRNMVPPLRRLALTDAEMTRDRLIDQCHRHARIQDGFSVMRALLRAASSPGKEKGK